MANQAKIKCIYVAMAGRGKKKERRKILYLASTHIHTHTKPNRISFQWIYPTSVSNILHIDCMCSVWQQQQGYNLRHNHIYLSIWNEFFSWYNTQQPPSIATTINRIPMRPTWIHTTRSSSRCQFVQYVSNSFTHSRSQVSNIYGTFQQ